MDQSCLVLLADAALLRVVEIPVAHSDDEYVVDLPDC
jgi:hypothetical protein